MQLQTDNLGKVSITVEEGYWDIHKDYDKLTVVEKEGTFGTFISRKPVPAGIELTNREYWIPFSSLKEEILIDYNAFLDKYKDQLDSYDEAIEDFKNKTEEVSDNLDKLKEGLEIIDDVKDSLNVLNETKNELTSHKFNKDNPHSVTKSQIGLSNVTNDAQIKRSEMGVSSGVATLDDNGRVPSSQLPSYVDDVLEYTNKSNFPTIGETGKIYVDITTNLTYRWSGSQYVEISPSLALGETSSTAYAGDKGAQLKADLNTINNYTKELHNVDINFNNKFKEIKSGYNNALPVVYIDKALDDVYYKHNVINDAYYAINPLNENKGIKKSLLYAMLKGTGEDSVISFIRGSLPISFRTVNEYEVEALEYVDVVGLISGGATEGTCSSIAFGKFHDNNKITNYIFRLDITTHVNDIHIVFNYINLTNVQTLASNTKFGFLKGLDFNDFNDFKFGVRCVDGYGHVYIPLAENNNPGLTINNYTNEDKSKLDNIRLATNNNYGLIQGYGNTMLDDGYAVQITKGLGKVIIPNATTTAKGLMSAEDKTKLDGISIANDTTAGLIKATVANTNIPTATHRFNIKILDDGTAFIDLPETYGNKFGLIRGRSEPNNYDTDTFMLRTIDGFGYVTIPNVTTEHRGIMSAEDKQKLDNLSITEESYTLPVASNVTLGGIKIGNNVTINDDGVLNILNATTIRYGLIKFGMENKPNEHLYSVNENIKYGGTYVTIPDATVAEKGLMTTHDKDKLYHSLFIIDINTCTINTELTTATETVGTVTLTTNEDYNTDLEKAFEDTDFTHNFIVKGILKTEYIKGSQVGDVDIYVNNIVSIGRTTYICKIVINTDTILYGIVEIKLQDISNNHVTFSYNIVDLLATQS